MGRNLRDVGAGGAGRPKVKEANSTEWAQRMHAVTTEARLCILERITPA